MFKFIKNLKNINCKKLKFLFYGGLVLVALYFIRQLIKNMEGFATTTPVQENSYYSFVPHNDGKSQICKPYKGDCLVNNIYSDTKCSVPIKCVVSYPPVLS
jgi:hypothetical protein